MGERDVFIGGDEVPSVCCLARPGIRPPNLARAESC